MLAKEKTAALNNAKIQLVYKEAQIKNINRRYNELDTMYDELKITAQLDKFLFYYIPLVTKTTRVLDLEESLSRYRWKEDTYKTNIFDCSEMSAALERVLENEGFHTFIVRGNSPDGSGIRHTWLIVETSPNEYIPVEATNPSIISWRHPYINEYNTYTHKFETIHEALNYSQVEYGWWEQ